MVSIACQSSSVNAIRISSPRAERSQVGDESADVVVAQGGAEGRHAGPSDRRAAVLDDVGEILVGVSGHARGVREVAGPDQEQSRAPGASAILAVTGGAESQVETRDAGGPRRGFGRIEQPGETADEET